MTWKCHVDDSTKVRYDIILRQEILTELGLYLKLYKHVIKVDYVPYKGSITPMVDFVTYIFKYLNTGRIKTEELFTNA